jgi:hypothetical protein
MRKVIPGINLGIKWERMDVEQRVHMLCQILPDKKMDQEKLHKLLEIADKQDQLKMKVLHNAVVKCIEDYRKDPTTARLKSWNAAESALEQFIDDLWGKHFHVEETLPNLLAVTSYLSDKGWKVGKSTVYNHKRDGKIRARKDGKFLVIDVENYAKANLEPRDGNTENSGAIDEMQLKKLRAETEKAAASARISTVKANVLQGLYVPREAFEQELAKRAAIFKNDIESFIRSQAMGMVHLVGGDAAKVPDLIEYMQDQAEGWLNRYAEEREFTIPQAVGDNLNEDKEEEEE